MSLTGALQIGKSALATHQGAIQVTGNNIANAGSADYTRQVANTSPTKDRQLAPGMFVGTGVQLDAVRRQIDEALEARLRGSISDSLSADTAQQWLGRIEAVFNELGDDDLSTRLSTFFAGWSNLANKPQDMGLRQVVLQEGAAVASWFNDMRRQLGGLQTDADDRLTAQVKDADALATQVAGLNAKIVAAEGGGTGQAAGLRDQRDAALKRLSELIDVRTVAQDGVVNVYLGSEPLVVNADNRGLALEEIPVNGRMTASVVIKATGGGAPVSSGQLGGLVAARAKLDGVIGQVDGLARGLIFELNKLHASGQGLEGFGSTTAANSVAVTSAALNDPAAGLPFAAANGSFVVHVRQKATGLVTSTLVQVDLDGSGPQTSLDSLRADLGGIAGVTASIAGGRLKVDATSDAVDISFSQDTSSALTALGVNTFYTGRDARDIAVNASLRSRPALLAAARNGEGGDNQTARAIAALESQAVGSLGGSSLKDSYQSMINEVGVATSTAKTEAEAASVVRETLASQREALSGVSLDEEAVNLMRQQRAFQGAARLVAAVDELMRTILGMVQAMAILPAQLARVSNLLRTNTAGNQIARTQRRLLETQNELSTGRRLNSASDDPGDAAIVQQLQKTLEQRQAFATNLNRAKSHLGAVDSTLGDLSDLLQKAQEIASANVGSDVTPDQRAGAAAIVESLYGEALTLANRQFEGVYLFGGDRSTHAPFVSEAGGVRFVGSQRVLQNAFDEATDLPFMVNGADVFGALSTRVQGRVDLSPAITTQTRLADLNGATGDGVRPGTVVLSNGTATAAVDLRGADTVGDVVDAINAAGVGGISAAVGAGGNQITLSGGAGDNITLTDAAGGTTAADLGLLTTVGGGAGIPVNGASVRPTVSPLTRLADLRSGAGIDTAGGLRITSGTETFNIDVSAAVTVEDLLNAVNGSGANVRAEVNAAGTGINIVNPAQGTTLSVAEDGGTTAADLGVRSFDLASPLADFNGGRGVRRVDGADFRVTRSDGSSFDVDIPPAANTVQDVITAINAASGGAGVTASLAASGNGIVLTDTAGGAGTVTVTPINFSDAAADLGLTAAPAAGSVIAGADVNVVSASGVFASLGKLRDALRANDQQGITASAEGLAADYARAARVRGETGARVQGMEARQGRLEDQDVATKALLANLAEVDLTEAISRFQTLQTSLQASMQTSANMLNLSLLDFLG